MGTAGKTCLQIQKKKKKKSNGASNSTSTNNTKAVARRMDKFLKGKR
jgi:hypothetical protein